jgi:hypothetical protein
MGGDGNGLSHGRLEQWRQQAAETGGDGNGLSHGRLEL